MPGVFGYPLPLQRVLGALQRMQCSPQSITADQLPLLTLTEARGSTPESSSHRFKTVTLETEARVWAGAGGVTAETAVCPPPSSPGTRREGPLPSDSRSVPSLPFSPAPVSLIQPGMGRQLVPLSVTQPVVPRNAGPPLSSM